MNIAACATYLLGHFTPEERSIPDSINYPGRNAAVLKAMNDALQDLFGRGRPWMRKDDRGEVIHAPAAVSVVVTAGSRSASMVNTAWQSWFPGCAIVLDGAEVDNELRSSGTAAGGNTGFTLKFPWTGASGTVAATIYQTGVPLAADVLEVLEPVRLDRVGLVAAGNPQAHGGAMRVEDYGMHRSEPRITADSVRCGNGRPQWFSVDTWGATATAAPGPRISIWPAPRAQGFLDYSATLRPPVINDISSTAELPIPFGFVESVFLPIAVSKLRNSQFWTGAEPDPSAARAAWDILADSNPQRRSGVTLYPKF